MDSRYAYYIAALLTGGALVVAGVSYAVAGNFGFGVNTNASAGDVGLPFYPGARPHHDKDNESGAKVWGSLGGFGMKVVAVELESSDAPGKIGSFYWGALGKYGPVLDCSYGKPRPPRAAKNEMRLDCSDDHPAPGELLIKAGVKRDFHVVGISPLGGGSKIALVSVQLRGVD